LRMACPQGALTTPQHDIPMTASTKVWKSLKGPAGTCPLASAMRAPRPGEACPVCGLPIDWVEKRVRNGHVYYYAYHYVKDENGKRKVKKCYLGADRYDYVSRKNYDLGTTFRGMAYSEADRFSEYFNSALDKLSAKVQSGTLEPEQARHWLGLLKDMNSRLERLMALLEDYLKELSKAQAQASEAYTVKELKASA